MRVNKLIEQLKSIEADKGNIEVIFKHHASIWNLKTNEREKIYTSYCKDFVVSCVANATGKTKDEQFKINIE